MERNGWGAECRREERAEQERMRIHMGQFVFLVW